MKNYDGWTIKQATRGGGSFLLPEFFHTTRNAVIKQFEKIMLGDTWRKYQRRGFNKIVRVKLIEIQEET